MFFSINVWSLDRLDPHGLVIVTGDLIPVSTSFENRLRRLTGLIQIIKISTRNNAFLDWCLTNSKKFVIDVNQLPPLVRVIIMVTITSVDWTEIYATPDPNSKYQRFNELISAVMNNFSPNKPTSVRESDKSWMTSSIKTSIRKRQKSFHKCGKNSQVYSFWRNKVQCDVRVARKKYYANSEQKFKCVNPSRWWNEVKSLDGLSCQKSWDYQLLSQINPTCEDLAEWQSRLAQIWFQIKF